ncbi:hypothetical protein BaRGS_00008925 [Batillaria attramentaria]|uniref:Fucosyltransferase n=1 Tax=Batillaria attramentaria TaxID=370345 RepID=A0ABD0LJZ1_9CAEN
MTIGCGKCPRYLAVVMSVPTRKSRHFETDVTLMSLRRGTDKNPELATLGTECVALVFCYCGRLASAPSLRQGTAPFIQYFPQREWREVQTKTALIWDERFPFRVDEANFTRCAVRDCRITLDKREIRSSDAVLFSSRGLWNRFRGYPMPKWRAAHQTFLDWSKYQGVFNWTLHYRRDADLVGVYGDVVPHSFSGSGPIIAVDTNVERMRNYAREKSKMVAWMASNCVDDARRQRMVQELSKYIPVDTYGACGDLPDGRACKQGTCEGLILRPYRFYLALENARCRGYVTEKLFNALGRAQIPITDNDVHSSGKVPRGSYIQIGDFASIKDLAVYLKKLAANETAYNQYLQWRHTHTVQLYSAPWCQLCSELHNKSRQAQVYTDLYGWLQNDTCQPWSVSTAVVVVGRFSRTS